MITSLWYKEKDCGLFYRVGREYRIPVFFQLILGTLQALAYAGHFARTQDGGSGPCEEKQAAR